MEFVAPYNYNAEDNWKMVKLYESNCYLST